MADSGDLGGPHDLGDPGLARVLATADAAVAACDDSGAARRFRIAARLRAGDGPAVVADHEAMLAGAAVGAFAWSDVHLVAGARALLAGRFADAGRLAMRERVASHNVSPDATAQLAAVAFWTDDVGALEARVAAAGADPRDVRLVAELSVIALLARRGDTARAAARFASDDFADPVSGPYRPAHLALAATAAVALGAGHRLPPLDLALQEYGGELLVAPAGMVVVDAADSVRGEVLGALGRIDDAIDCCTRADAPIRNAQAVVLDVVNGHRTAHVLARRNGPGDRARAAVLARRALEQAGALGMANDARAARDVLRALDFEVG
jgi:hypothetical protein